MKKESKYIFLFANTLSKEGDICNTAYGFAISGKDGVGMKHHLYILSDNEIKEGDYYYLPKENKIAQCQRGLRLKDVTPEWTQKIIATTNPELHTKKNPVHNENSYVDDIPKISQPDIEYIISLYNGKSEVEKLADDYRAEHPVGNSDIMLAFEDGYNALSEKINSYIDSEIKRFDGLVIKEEKNYGAGSEYWSQYKQSIGVLRGVKESFCKELPKRDTIMILYENVNLGWQFRANSGKQGSTFVPDKYELKLKDGCIIIVKD